MATSAAAIDSARAATANPRSSPGDVVFFKGPPPTSAASEGPGSSPGGRRRGPGVVPGVVAGGPSAKAASAGTDAVASPGESADRRSPATPAGSREDSPLVAAAPAMATASAAPVPSVSIPAADAVRAAGTCADSRRIDVLEPTSNLLAELPWLAAKPPAPASDVCSIAIAAAGRSVPCLALAKVARAAGARPAEPGSRWDAAARRAEAMRRDAPLAVMANRAPLAG